MPGLGRHQRRRGGAHPGGTVIEPPTNTGAASDPTITGTLQLGNTLTAHFADDDPDGAASSIVYAWAADDTPISGATTATLDLEAAQVGKAITVTVSYTDGAGFSESVTSAATDDIADADPVDTGEASDPTITGTPTQGETLTAVFDDDDPDGAATATAYQWMRDGVDIAGATGSTRILVSGDVGAAMSVAVTYTDGKGFEATVTSDETAAVEASAGGDYPDAIVSAGLQSVYDRRIGGPDEGLAGIQIEPTKIFDPADTSNLDANMIWADPFLYLAPASDDGLEHVIEGWDFSLAPNEIVTSTGSLGTTSVHIKNCRFKAKAAFPSPYMIAVNDIGPDNGKTKFTNCEIDGSQLTGTGLSSAISSPLVGTVEMVDCLVKNMPSDGLKSDATFIATGCRFQACGWDSSSDPDCFQAGGGVVNVSSCIFDIHDGSDLGDSFPGQPANNLFRVESFAADFTQVRCVDNVFIGINPGFGSLAGAYVTIDAKDVNPNAFSDVLYQNNVIEKGHALYTGQDGTTRFPYLTSAEWVGNYDFLTGEIIPVPDGT